MYAILAIILCGNIINSIIVDIIVVIIVVIVDDIVIIKNGVGSRGASQLVVAHHLSHLLQVPEHGITRTSRGVNGRVAVEGVCLFSFTRPLWSTGWTGTLCAEGWRGVLS